MKDLLVRIIPTWLWILIDLFPPIVWKVAAIVVGIMQAMLWTGQLLSKANP